MKKNYIVVVIAGSTNGGKTSISDRLVEEYPNSIQIKQDDYFLEENSSNHLWVTLSNKIRHQNWEHYSSIDWIKLDKNLAKLNEKLTKEPKIEVKNESKSGWKNKSSSNAAKKNSYNLEKKDLETIKKDIKLILIEGHILLCHNFPKFLNIDKKVFFTLSKEVCKERRSARAYIPPDPPNYFEECVWPSYVEHFNYAKANHLDALFINGELDKETIFQRIKKEIDDVYLNLIN